MAHYSSFYFTEDFTSTIPFFLSATSNYSVINYVRFFFSHDLCECHYIVELSARTFFFFFGTWKSLFYEYYSAITINIFKVNKNNKSIFLICRNGSIMPRQTKHSGRTQSFAPTRCVGSSQWTTIGQNDDGNG